MPGFALALALLTTAAPYAPYASARPAIQSAAQAASDAAAQQADDAQADAPEPIRRDLSFTLPAGQPIDIDNPYGSVYLRFGGYEHRLDIRATIQQPTGAREFAFAPAAQDGRFVVAPNLPAGVVLADAQRIDLVLYVPDKHTLKVRTVGGSIDSRGIKADVDFRSETGDIFARGTEGAMQAESAEGRIQVMLGAAPAGSYQRLATRTGDLVVGVTDALGAEVRMSTSGTLTTDYSLQIEHRDSEEPDKRARAAVGAQRSGKANAVLALESLRGNLRLWRRADFADAPDADRVGDGE